MSFDQIDQLFSVPRRELKDLGVLTPVDLITTIRDAYLQDAPDMIWLESGGLLDLDGYFDRQKSAYSNFRSALHFRFVRDAHQPTGPGRMLYKNCSDDESWLGVNAQPDGQSISILDQIPSGYPAVLPSHLQLSPEQVADLHRCASFIKLPHVQKWYQDLASKGVTGITQTGFSAHGQLGVSARFVIPPFSANIRMISDVPSDFYTHKPITYVPTAPNEPSALPVSNYSVPNAVIRQGKKRPARKRAARIDPNRRAAIVPLVHPVSSALTASIPSLPHTSESQPSSVTSASLPSPVTSASQPSLVTSAPQPSSVTSVPQPSSVTSVPLLSVTKSTALSSCSPHSSSACVPVVIQQLLLPTHVSSPANSSSTENLPRASEKVHDTCLTPSLVHLTPNKQSGFSNSAADHPDSASMPLNVRECFDRFIKQQRPSIELSGTNTDAKYTHIRQRRLPYVAFMPWSDNLYQNTCGIDSLLVTLYHISFSIPSLRALFAASPQDHVCTALRAAFEHMRGRRWDDARRVWLTHCSHHGGLDLFGPMSDFWIAHMNDSPFQAMLRFKICTNPTCEKSSGRITHEPVLHEDHFRCVWRHRIYG